MNTAPTIDGEGVDKKTYLRHLLTETETELALLDQRDLVVGYMAKLVALDAMALSDEVSEREAELQGRPEMHDVTQAVQLFVVPN